MSKMDLESDLKGSMKAGGRPLSDGWARYDFTKVPGDKGKSLAKCGKCHQELKNTSIIRMAKHRNKCGATAGLQTSQVLIKNNDDHDESNKIQIIEAYSTNEDQNAVKTIYWTTEEQEEPAEKIEQQPQQVQPQQTINIIQQEDIGRSSKKLSSSSLNRRSRPSRSSASNFLDALLSRFIIGSNLSFDIVDSTHFKRFANAMNHDYVVPSSSQLKARVLNQLQTLDPLPEKSRKRRYESFSEYESDSD